MTFDPFGDYATRGYLRNTQGADEVVVKRLEHAAFRGSIETALDNLKSKPVLTYEDVLQTHADLFASVYPWAGQDRSQTSPDIAVGKNGNYDLFAHPGDIRRSVETALNMASDPKTMRAKPGEIMSYLAYGHPFLDGNGRTITIVHTELCRRARMGIDWCETNKHDYLAALTKELQAPGKRYLDDYLKSYIRDETIDHVRTVRTLRNLPGLGPSVDLTKSAVNDTSKPEVLVPAAHLPDLSASEVSERVQASDFVQRKKAEAEQLSLIVFGSSAAISDSLSRIDRNPALASGIASELKTEPGQLGVLAGEAGGWIRRASQERQNAEANLPRLATAIDDYGSAVRYQQSRIVQEHSAEQRRVSQEVPMPSADLAKVLRSMPEAQVQQFSERPDLRRELTQLSIAFDKRLAPLEHKALHDGDMAFAQRSLSVSSQQISQIAQAKQQFREANQVVRSRTLAQWQGPVITR